MEYRNPVIRGYSPDPTICRVEEDFYLVNSSFEFFPGLPVYHSKNLVNWELVSYCLKRKKQVNLFHCAESGGIYAPTLRRYKDFFSCQQRMYQIEEILLFIPKILLEIGQTRYGWIKRELIHLSCLPRMEQYIFALPDLRKERQESG